MSSPTFRVPSTLVLALVMTLLMALTGCNGNDDSAQTNRSDESAPESNASAAGRSKAAAQTIRARIIGNTVVGTMDPDSEYAEFYAPDGTIRGAGYQAAWEIENDRLCFDYDESPQADCYAVQIDGEAVEWHRGGEIQGRGTIVEGNPNNF